MSLNTMQGYSVSQVADICGVSKETVRRWDKSGKLTAERNPNNEHRVYSEQQLMQFDEGRLFFRQSNEKTKKNDKIYSCIELFAGAGGLALGLEKAGFEPKLLNEIDKDAANTLKYNNPDWNVQNCSISDIDFSNYRGQIDLVSGGFPCQAFSYAGKKMGFEDVRGTLFFEFARCVKEVRPKMFLGENVRGIMRHDNGRTLKTIVSVLEDLGYHVFEPRLLKAIHYKVPQKRERVLIVGVLKEHWNQKEFCWPNPYGKVYTVKDALKKGELFDKNVPKSVGQEYPETKKKIMDLVPPGGYWRDLPLDIQKEYMKKSFYLGGGKTGMARRMSWDEPSLTLTCAPAQKQTERCHPDETRPFETREYARIQTFPDDWHFTGSKTSIYKQIGNAVPVNLAEVVGHSIATYLNQIDE